MKKRTKKKLAKYSGNVVRGLFKLVLVYPFKGLWFISKQGYYAIKGNKRTNIERNVGEKSIIGKTAQGVLNHEAKHEALDEIKHIKGNFEKFTEKLYENKSTIGLILGARGTGKSAIGMRFLENFKTKTDKNVYALGFKRSALPKWITLIGSIDQIENNSILLIDEGGIEFSSRKSMSDANTFLSEILLIARHKDLSVLFITQNSANLEVNVIRQADYLIMKPSSLLQKDFERKRIKTIYEKAEEDFDELKGTEGLTYIYADNYQGFATNSLPTFWSEKVSKGYANK